MTNRPQLPPAYWTTQIRADLARRRAEEADREIETEETDHA